QARWRAAARPPRADRLATRCRQYGDRAARGPQRMSAPGSAFARALRNGGRAIQRAGFPLVRLDETLFLDEARQRTGLEDFGDPRVHEPLPRVVAELHTPGPRCP